MPPARLAPTRPAVPPRIFVAKSGDPLPGACARALVLTRHASSPPEQASTHATQPSLLGSAASRFLDPRAGSSAAERWFYIPDVAGSTPVPPTIPSHVTLRSSPAVRTVRTCFERTYRQRPPRVTREA